MSAEKSEQLGGISFVASEPFSCVLSHLDPPFSSLGLCLNDSDSQLTSETCFRCELDSRIMSMKMVKINKQRKSFK